MISVQNPQNNKASIEPDGASILICFSNKVDSMELACLKRELEVAFACWAAKLSSCYEHKVFAHFKSYS